MQDFSQPCFPTGASQLRSPTHFLLPRRRYVLPVAFGHSKPNVVDFLVQVSSPTPQSLSKAEILSFTRLGQADHYARTTYQKSSMSRRGIHPLLMGVDKPRRSAHIARQQDLSGYESAQRKRFLRAEIEEEKQAAAEGRRHLLRLERQAT